MTETVSAAPSKTGRLPIETDFFDASATAARSTRSYLPTVERPKPGLFAKLYPGISTLAVDPHSGAVLSCLASGAHQSQLGRDLIAAFIDLDILSDGHFINDRGNGAQNSPQKTTLAVSETRQKAEHLLLAQGHKIFVLTCPMSDAGGNDSRHGVVAALRFREGTPNDQHYKGDKLAVAQAHLFGTCLPGNWNQTFHAELISELALEQIALENPRHTGPGVWVEKVADLAFCSALITHPGLDPDTRIALATSLTNHLTYLAWSHGKGIALSPRNDLSIQVLSAGSDMEKCVALLSPQNIGDAESVFLTRHWFCDTTFPEKPKELRGRVQNLCAYIRQKSDGGAEMISACCERMTSLAELVSNNRPRSCFFQGLGPRWRIGATPGSLLLEIVTDSYRWPHLVPNLSSKRSWGLDSESLRRQCKAMLPESAPGGPKA